MFLKQCGILSKSGLMKPFGLIISFSHPMNIKTCKLCMCKAGVGKLDPKTNSRHVELRASGECRDVNYKVK